MEKINIKAAKKLLERYRQITIDDIGQEAEESGLFVNGQLMGWIVATNLTKFGSFDCLLCSAAKRISFSERKRDFCQCCIYNAEKLKQEKESCKCKKGENKKTYDAIDNSESANELFRALQERANHIEKIINRLEDKQ